jgi:hypothetical protein
VKENNKMKKKMKNVMEINTIINLLQKKITHTHVYIDIYIIDYNIIYIYILVRQVDITCQHIYGCAVDRIMIKPKVPYRYARIRFFFLKN